MQDIATTGIVDKHGSDGRAAAACLFVHEFPFIVDAEAMTGRTAVQRQVIRAPDHRFPRDPKLMRDCWDALGQVGPQFGQTARPRRRPCMQSS